MSVIDLISPATGMKLMIATKKSSAGNSARKSSRPAAPPARGSCRRPLRDRCVSPARSTTAEHATFAASGPDPVTIERRGRVPFRLSQQPVVKLQLHSAGAASLLHPNAAAALGAPGLAALLLVQILPVLHPPCTTRTVGTPLCARRAAPPGSPRRGLCAVGWIIRAHPPPSVRRWTFTTGC